MLVQDILQRFQRLFGELIPVRQKQNPLSAPRFDEPLQIEAYQVGLAGACRKFHEEPPFAQLDSLVERTHNILLVGANRPLLSLTQVVILDRNRSERFSGGAHLDEPLEIAPRIERV